MVGTDNLLKPISLRQVQMRTGPVISAGYRDRRQSTLDLSIWMQFSVQRNRFEALDIEGIFGTAYQQTELEMANVKFLPFVTARFNYYFR